MEGETEVFEESAPGMSSTPVKQEEGMPSASDDEFAPDSPLDMPENP